MGCWCSSDTMVRPLPVVAIMLCVALPACDETLPPRNEPTEFLSTAVLQASPVEVRDGLPAWDRILFNALSVTVTNTYDEALQDRALVRGDMEVFLEGAPQYRRELVVTSSDIFTPGVLNGDVLTIGIDSSVVFLHWWDHRTSEGIPFWHYRRQTTLKFTPKGKPYYETDTLYLVAGGAIKLFQNVQPRPVAARRFPVVYQIYDTLLVTP